MPTHTFPANFEALDSIREFVGDSARDAGMDAKEIYAVQLATDEAASNVIEHAYEGASNGELEISCEINSESLTIVMHDRGEPFDPNKVVVPDVTADLDERPLGGLGVFLMHKLMDEVRYKTSPKTGNVLTMIKRRAGVPAPKKKNAGLRELFGLGDDMLNAITFADQRDTILEALMRVVPEAEITLWLDEAVFRLPDWKENLFPPEAPTETMRRAFETRKTVSVKGTKPTLTIPIQSQHSGLGVVEIVHKRGRILPPRQRDLLEALVRHAAVSLLAWHRISVERWRLGQLALVRMVAAQIANILDIDELARRVTRLIQTTFKYYYVTIFTLERGETQLDFRSSAGGATRRTSGGVAAPVLNVAVGQGLIGAAALSGDELLINDVSAEPRFRHIDSLPETRSELVIPLKIDERIVGVLDVQSDQLNSFHPYDLLVLRSLADSVAIAIEDARLYGTLRRRAEQMELIAEVGKRITAKLNLRELMDEVAGLVQTHFGFPYIHLFTVHPTRRQIHYEAGSGARSEALEGYTLNLDDPDGIVAWVARNGQVLLANDVNKEPLYRPSPLPPANTQSELAVPMIAGGQVYGVLDVQSEKLNAFSEDDRLLFETLADSVAAGIRNADLYRSEQWRRQVADSLREVAGLLSDNATLEQVLDSILTELERNMPSDIAAIWLLDENDLYLAAAHGAPAADLERARLSWPGANEWLLSALLARQPIIRKPTDSIGPAGVAGNYSADYSNIAAPLRIGDQPLGILTLAHHTPGRYGHEAQAMTTTFASYAAVAIENARLYDQSQEQAYASAALLQVAQAVVSLSDLDEILGTIVRIMPILVGVERSAIYTLDSASGLLMPSKAHGLPSEFESLVFTPLKAEDFPILSAALESGQPAFSAEAHRGVEAWPTLQPAAPEDTNYVLQSEDRLLMAFPLMVKNEMFGVLLLEEAMGGRRFRARRVEILTGIAQQIALAIQNEQFQREILARERLELEVNVARQIQRKFIPETLPTNPAWDFSARWRTARQVGGDFYDVFELPDQRIGLFIADVADKGVPAALFMALTRTLVRAAVAEAASPADVLRRVNDLLYPDAQQGMFVTGVYGVLNSLTGDFTYANAGHNPPLWLKCNERQIERLTRTGMALGVVLGTPMEQRTIRLNAGDILTLYTDGVTEAFNSANEAYGEERLNAVVLTCGESAVSALDAIEESVNAFVAGEPAADDMTLLAIKRLGTTAPTQNGSA
jgi:serine phosphatase RsbU (regulator of sigma subunit)/putative methionine-R-sulfoxide reductase with GAF domain/anti-sigma regulatory factor (Ser/Thr protein kinase)